MTDQKEMDLTQLLKDRKWDELAPHVYKKLHEIARKVLLNRRYNTTLESRDLVNRAFEKLMDKTRIDWQDRVHFYSYAATVMRGILINYAKHRSTQKAGGRVKNLPLEAAASLGIEVQMDTLLDVEKALQHLEKVNPRQSAVFVNRYYGGMTTEETAETLGISTATVKRDLKHARLWLAKELQDRKI